MLCEPPGFPRRDLAPEINSACRGHSVDYRNIR
jgi:hypothetical protein